MTAMMMRFPIRFLTLTVGLSASAAMGQSTLPPAAPTTLAIGTAGPVSTGVAARRADIDFTDGLLRISANNSSLNQILREIGRLTGMKITGGVTEDRVFGTYGPAPASQVITSLLDGTTSNTMIVENSADGPAELILTPRKGGATPPNPNASAMENDDQNPPTGPPRGQYMPPRAGGIWEHPPGPGGTPNGLPASNGGQTGTPINGGADLGSTPGAFTPYGQTPPDARAQPDSVLVNTDNPVAVPAPATTPTTGTDGSQPQSPSGVSTPQQIYEQLQKLRQQQTTTPPQ